MTAGGQDRAEELARLVRADRTGLSDPQKEDAVDLLSSDNPETLTTACEILLLAERPYVYDDVDPVVRHAADDLFRIIESYDRETIEPAGELLMDAVVSDVIDVGAVTPHLETVIGLFAEVDWTEAGREFGETDLREVVETIAGMLAHERQPVHDRFRELAHESSGTTKAGSLAVLAHSIKGDRGESADVESLGALFRANIGADDEAVKVQAVVGVQQAYNAGLVLDPALTSTLFEMMASETVSLRATASTILASEMADNDDVKARMLDALAADDTRLRGAAASGFHSYLFDDDADPTEDELSSAATALAETIERDDTATWTQVNALDAVEWFVREYPPIAEGMTGPVVDVIDDETDPEVLESALDVLSRIRYHHAAAGSRAVRPVSELLDHRDPEIQAQALSEMDGIGISYPEAVTSDLDQIVGKLDAEEDQVVEEALSVLDRVAEEVPVELESEVPALQRILFEGELDPSGIFSKGVADEAASVLAQLASESPDEIESVTRDLFEDLNATDADRRMRAAAFLPKFVDFESEAFRDKRDELLVGLAHTLSNGDGAERKLAAEAYKDIFQSAETEIRWATAHDDEYDQTLEETTPGLEETVTALIHALDDETEDVGWHAMDALQSIAEYNPAIVRAHVDTIAALVEEPVDDRQREDALACLTAIGQEYPTALVDLVPQLEAGLRQAEADDVGDIAEILANIATDHPESVRPAAPVLRDHLTNPDIDGFDWAELTQALANIGSEYPSELFPVADQFVSVLTVGSEEIAEPADSGDDDSLLGPRNQLAETFEEFFDSRGPDVELYATEAIATAALEKADPFIPAIEPLAAIIEDGTEYEGLRESTDEVSDRLAKHWAAFAIAAIAYRKPEAVVGVADTVASLLDDDEPLIRSMAVRTIAFVAEHDPETVSDDAKLTTLYLLEDDDAVTREYACYALGGMGAEMAKSELKKLSRTDPDADVQTAAEIAVTILEDNAERSVVDIEETGNDIGIHIGDPDEEFKL